MTSNRERLLRTAEELGPLCKDMVFTGGSITELLITDTAVKPSRPTLDVDVIVRVAAKGDYHDLIPKLGKRGFQPDSSSRVICRFRKGDLVLDVMPSDPSILGFSNPWYEPAFQNSWTAALSGATRIQVISAPYFLATKCAAFRSRGKSDYFTSHDFEDMIAVIDGRSSIADEVRSGDSPIKKCLADEFAKMLADTAFDEAISANLHPDPESQRRRPMVKERIGKIAAMKSI